MKASKCKFESENNCDGEDGQRRDDGTQTITFFRWRQQRGSDDVIHEHAYQVLTVLVPGTGMCTVAKCRPTSSLQCYWIPRWVCCQFGLPTSSI